MGRCHSHNNCEQAFDPVLFIGPSEPAVGPHLGGRDPSAGLCLAPVAPSPPGCPAPSQEMEGMSEKGEGLVWLGMFL